MKLLPILSVLSLSLMLTACPQKKAAEDQSPTEQVEGSSANDKSGEGSSEEMQEKKGGSAEGASVDPGAAGGDSEKK